MGLLGPHIFVAGGYNADYSVAFADTLKINPETGETTPGANLLTGRGDFGFVSTGANARAYAVGGFNSADFCTPLSSVETLDLNSNWPDFAPSKPLLVAVWKSKFYGAFERAESSRRPPRHRRDACSLVDFHTGAGRPDGRRELPLPRAAGHEPAARARARLPVEDEAPEALARVNEP